MLTIQRANPLDFAESLKALFANESQALVSLVDDAYADVARNGGASWVGLDENGEVQLNVTLFPHDFEFRGRTVRAGMLANTVASKNYRWFFPSVSLVKQLVRDVSQEAQLDFLYTDPQPSAAVVNKAAGLEQVGALDRFVIPLTDSRLLHALAARAYANAVRLRLGFSAARYTTIDPASYDFDRFAVPLGTSSRLRPHHTTSMYRRRLRGYPGPNHLWCEFRLRSHGHRAQPDAAVLLEGPDERKVAHVCAIRRAPNVPLPSLIPGVLRAARERGAHRLQIETIRESDLARDLLHIGFRRRDDLVPIFARAITAAGREVVSSIHDWELTTLDLER